MVGLAQLQHHVIGHVDHGADGPHTGQGEAPADHGGHDGGWYPFYDRPGKAPAERRGRLLHPDVGPLDIWKNHMWGNGQ